jgi:hypothetical protein
MGTVGAAMNLFLWPRYHDPSYRPTLRELVSIHWRANLRMLRVPRDLVVFTVISILPVLGLFAATELFPTFFSGAPDEILVRLVAICLLFFPVQHVAFMIAMDLTYTPHVRAAIRERGVPVCLRCGHLLPPNAPDASCPECGATGSSATIRDSGRGEPTEASPADPSMEVPRR